MHGLALFLVLYGKWLKKLKKLQLTLLFCNKSMVGKGYNKKYFAAFKKGGKSKSADCIVEANLCG